MRTDLLPPNSTDLERKLAQVGAPAILDLGDDAAIRGRKFDPPENWLDALIWEYALGEITPYISDKRRLISEGIRWTRLRGTPASLHSPFRGLGWTPTSSSRRLPSSTTIRTLPTGHIATLPSTACARTGCPPRRKFASWSTWPCCRSRYARACGGWCTAMTGAYSA